MECSQPAQIPKELMTELEPPRLARRAEDVMAAYFYNMEKLGVCYSKYNALRMAIEARERD